MTEGTSDAITVVSGRATVEIDKIRGSRFIGDIAPVDSPDAATSFIASIRDREPHASHYCWAHRITIDEIRTSDDGEPTGTGGPPILRRLESASLWRAVIVVTRYYGGTNLGTGGLIRAYGEAAAAVISSAPIARRCRMASYRLRHPYDVSAIIERVLATHSGVITGSTYTDAVDLTVSVPEASGSAFIDDVRDSTAGTVIPVLD